MAKTRAGTTTGSTTSGGRKKSSTVLQRTQPADVAKTQRISARSGTKSKSGAVQKPRGAPVQAHPGAKANSKRQSARETDPEETEEDEDEDEEMSIEDEDEDKLYSTADISPSPSSEASSDIATDQSSQASSSRRQKKAAHPRSQGKSTSGSKGKDNTSSKVQSSSKSSPHPDALSSPSGPNSLSSPIPFLKAYRITHNEIGVLTVEPYKSALLPLWRFRTVPIATDSAAQLWDRFRAYGDQGDFVGMDMARKFIQMGMTRAKRYANYKGGKKYATTHPAGTPACYGRDGQPRGPQLAKSSGHDGKNEKEEASAIFREYWERCKEDGRYAELKEEFLQSRKRWEDEGRPE